MRTVTSCGGGGIVKGWPWRCWSGYRWLLAYRLASRWPLASPRRWPSLPEYPSAQQSWLPWVPAFLWGAGVAVAGRVGAIWAGAAWVGGMGVAVGGIGVGVGGAAVRTWTSEAFTVPSGWVSATTLTSAPISGRLRTMSTGELNGDTRDGQGIAAHALNDTRKGHLGDALLVPVPRRLLGGGFPDRLPAVARD